MVSRRSGHDDGDVVAPSQHLSPTLDGAGASSNAPASEDATVVGPDWFALSDGIGGHPGGALASAACTATIRCTPAPTAVDDVAALFDAVNRTVRATARAAGAPGLGATLVLVTTFAGRAVVAHVGDSRCYRLARGELTLLTRDHSHVQELIDLGRLRAGEAVGHPMRHVVTRALGLDATVSPDIATVDDGDGRLLLCSDGVSDVLSARTIGRVLTGVDDPAAAAQRLVALAARHGGDDASAIVIDQRYPVPE